MKRRFSSEVITASSNRGLLLGDTNSKELKVPVASISSLISTIPSSPRRLARRGYFGLGMECGLEGWNEEADADGMSCMPSAGGVISVSAEDGGEEKSTCVIDAEGMEGDNSALGGAGF